MARASLKLPNGTVVILEGTPEEVKQLLESYGGEPSEPSAAKDRTRARKPRDRVTMSAQPRGKSEGKPEQGWREPSGAAQTLLKIAERHPEFVLEVAS